METMKTQMPFLKEKPIFEKVANIASLAAMESDEFQSYMDSVDAYRTAMAAFAFSEMKGEARGIEIGEARGEARAEARERKKAHEEKLASARSFKSLGALTTKQIAEALGLTEEEVEEA